MKIFTVVGICPCEGGDLEMALEGISIRTAPTLEEAVKIAEEEFGTTLKEWGTRPDGFQWVYQGVENPLQYVAFTRIDL